MKWLKKQFVYALSCAIVLSGCVTNNSGPNAGNVGAIVGPQLSSLFDLKRDAIIDEDKHKLDVIIPVFDPGLLDDDGNATTPSSTPSTTPVTSPVAAPLSPASDTEVSTPGDDTPTKERRKSKGALHKIRKSLGMTGKTALLADDEAEAAKKKADEEAAEAKAEQEAKAKADEEAKAAAEQKRIEDDAAAVAKEKADNEAAELRRKEEEAAAAKSVTTAPPAPAGGAFGRNETAADKPAPKAAEPCCTIS